MQHIPGILKNTVDKLLQASLAESTRGLYENAWKKLVMFMFSLGATPRLPISVSITLLFVAHLHCNNFASASIVSIISAISYFHKINGVMDPTKALIVVKAITGTRNLATIGDIRLPITSSILSKLVNATWHVFQASAYKALIMRTMMVLAFKAYLRVGEMVPRNKSIRIGCLQINDILITEDCMIIHFKHFKHSGKHGAQTLNVRTGCIEGTNLDAIAMMKQFLIARGRTHGILFAFPDGTPMLRREFDTSLKTLLRFSGFSTDQFKGHSFRIGAATAAALRGDSDAQIRAAGRWSSDAFKSYIRLS